MIASINERAAEIGLRRAVGARTEDIRLPGQIQIHLQLVPRVRSYHEGSRLHGKQVILTHDPSDTLVVYQHSTTPQFGRDPSVAVAASVLYGDLLYRRTHLHIFFHRHSFLQVAVEARPADSRQLAHPLDPQAALHRHQLLDLVEDAVPPELSLLWRRASILCKAPLKKPASSVLSATTCFRCATCWRSSRSRPFAGGPRSSAIGSS
jgi:hypothetical protein